MMPKTDSICDNEGSEPEAGEFTVRNGLRVSYEIRVVHGEEASRLRRRQAEAVRALLLWLDENTNSAARLGEAG